METLHLTFQSIKPPLFLFSQNNFIKITHANPRQGKLSTRCFKARPGVFPAGGIGVTIETRKPLDVINSMVNNNIYMTVKERLDVYLYIIWPKQSQTTPNIMSWNHKNITLLNFSSYSLQHKLVNLSRKKNNLGSLLPTKATNLSSICGFPSPQQFQLRQLIAFGVAGSQPPSQDSPHHGNWTKPCTFFYLILPQCNPSLVAYPCY